MRLNHNSDFCNKIKGQPSDGDVYERKLWHDFKIAMRGGAVITGNYRYLLWREWDSNRKTVAFIMLNPSRADAEINDPTITRCINFANSWGYGRLEVVNLFAYRTSKPSLLKQAAEPIGKDNDRYILDTAFRSDRVILAWGNHGTWQQQDLYVLQLLKSYKHLYSLGITKKGCPRHPLYLRSNTQPQMFNTTAFCRNLTVMGKARSSLLRRVRSK